MQLSVVLPILLGIMIVGLIQFSYAEEEKTTFIAVDEEQFKQPQSKYNYQEITIIGYVEDYSRGQKVTIVISNPDESEQEMEIFASKKGEVYTLLHVTNDSQIGIHDVTMIYGGVEIASTSFEILEN